MPARAPKLNGPLHLYHFCMNQKPNHQIMQPLFGKTCLSECEPCHHTKQENEDLTASQNAGTKVYSDSKGKNLGNHVCPQSPRYQTR